MGRAKLRIYAALGRAAGRTFDVDIPRSCTLNSLLRAIAEQHGFTHQLFDESGNLRRSYTVLVNGTSMYYLDGLNTLVKDGDEVVILAFVAGGSSEPGSRGARVRG